MTIFLILVANLNKYNNDQAAWFWSVTVLIPLHTIVAGYYGFTLDVRVSVNLSSVRPSVHFSFPDDNFSKYQWIITKFGMCIDIVEIWFGIANGQIL